MENNLQIGVVLKKRENIYTPEKTIYGSLSNSVGRQ